MRGHGKHSTCSKNPTSKAPEIHCLHVHALKSNFYTYLFTLATHAKNATVEKFHTNDGVSVKQIILKLGHRPRSTGDVHDILREQLIDCVAMQNLSYNKILIFLHLHILRSKMVVGKYRTMKQLGIRYEAEMQKKLTSKETAHVKPDSDYMLKHNKFTVKLQF